ncbi:hypothetical protein D3C77_606990 [compost metagenome]
MIEKGQSVQNGLVTGTGFSYALAIGDLERVERKLHLRSSRADAFGYRGYITIKLDGHEIGRVPVYEQGSTIPSSVRTGNFNIEPDLTASTNYGWGNTFISVIKSLLLVG